MKKFWINLLCFLVIAGIGIMAFAETKTDFVELTETRYEKMARMGKEIDEYVITFINAQLKEGAKTNGDVISLCGNIHDTHLVSGYLLIDLIGRFERSKVDSSKSELIKIEEAVKDIQYHLIDISTIAAEKNRELIAKILSFWEIAVANTSHVFDLMAELKFPPYPPGFDPKEKNQIEKNTVHSKLERYTKNYLQFFIKEKK